MNEVIDECDSTNNLARVMGEAGAPNGAWISARMQTGGRGRLGRKWESQEGNLFLSMIARIADRNLFTWIPLATAVGIAETLRAENFEAQIKWPNDIWLSRKKAGGILCEAIGSTRDSFIIIGIGLNCLHAPVGLDQETTSLTIEAGRAVVADDIRLKTVTGVNQILDDLQAHGSALLRDRYRKLAAYPPGTRVEWGNKNGVVEDIGEIGELIVSTDTQKNLKLYAEDVKIKIAR